MIKNNYQFEVRVNGKPIKEYLQNEKIYIEGKKETQYSLHFKNNDWRRVLVIPTIDGLNVLTGKPASVNDQGYIVKGYESITIDGWRTSDKEVAKFYFSDIDKAYSVKRGEANNLGVIGCAVVREKQKLVRYDLSSLGWQAQGQEVLYGDVTIQSFNANSLDGLSEINAFYASNVNNANLNTAKQEIGTGFGEKKHSEVIKVEFDREDDICALFAIYYNTRKQLEQMGITFIKPQYISPNPFPKDSEYCEEPEE